MGNDKQLGPEMWDRNEVAIGNFRDWRSRNQVFDQLGSLFYTDMHLTGAGEPERIKSCVVTTNFFQVLGVQPMLGRTFLPEEETPGHAFAVILDPGKQVWREIVGVAGNVKHKALETDVMPEVYFPYQQFPVNFMNLVVHTDADPVSMIPAIRNQVLSIDKDQPVADIMTMEQRLAGSVASSRSVMLLLSSFSILALGLAAVGIYGVMAYLVTQRTQEIGVRMALGAQRHDVLRLVVGKGMVLAVMGTVIGLGAALALTRLMRSLLFEVTPTDWLTFVIAAMVLLTVTLLACYIPARRATRVDPLIALRYE